MKIIKSDTDKETIDRLANIFETWRAMLSVEVGPELAGADTIWSCKALRQLVGGAPSVKAKQPASGQPETSNRFVTHLIHPLLGIYPKH